ncbi:MAG: HAMP domain-containing histidine kinase [Lachnospiraceae bacterium]|nr:HAMP domain-containing histidine kinase [Lachnospiraceae bacterium]
MMKILRESVIAKLTAWVLCIVSVLGSVVLGIFVILGVNEDLFYMTRGEMLQEVYESVNTEFSLQVVEYIGNSSYSQMLREQGFQYGIIKSDSLKGINFHDKLSYLETNMTEEELKAVDVDKFYINQILYNDKHSRISYSWGYYGDYNDISALDASGSNFIEEHAAGWRHLYADRICYDVAKGILYYRAEGNYYPVQNVSLCHNGTHGQVIYNYNYDFGGNVYKLNFKSSGEGTVWEEEPEIAAEIPQTESAEDNDLAKGVDTDKIERILGGEDGAGSTVNLAELNDTSFNYTNWGTLLLDNIRSIDSSELTLIESGNYSDEYFISQPGYYLNENFTLVVSEELQTDNYWVVSIVPESVPTNQTNNKYVEEGLLVNIYYDIMDRNVFQGLAISIFVMVVSFSFLVYAVGHRRGVEDVVLTWFDRIPIDVLSLCACVVEGIMLLLFFYIIEESNMRASVYACIWVFCMFGIVMIVIGMRYMLSLCVRVKAGKWWRNSLCYWVYSRIRNMIVYIFRNIGLLWRIILVIGVVSFIEFCVLVGFYDRGGVVLLWLLKKLVVCAVVFVLVSQIHELQKASRHMAEGNLSYKIDTDKMFWECRKHGENLNKIGEGMAKAVDERMKSERFKTELITNVSHDIKTPLTSIINYVDLLGKEELHNEKASEYLEVLERQSSKLKKLIEDLVEASKASTGSLSVDSQRMEVGVFVTQTVGEFEEKLSLAGLELIVSKTDETVYIMADGRHLWRVIDNLMNNICKYAQTGSRVYVNIEFTEKTVSITFRNISKYPLNINGEELMERFVRGDKSRNTEGHGLGLSIAQSLMKLINGDMRIVVDGDLFKVVLKFNRDLPDMQELMTVEKEDEGEKF